ncbi:hypothetical protein CR513_29668, partial [Mucuna pruriens]
VPPLNIPVDKELYAFVRALHVSQHYLLPKEFVVHSDSESLKQLRGQGKLNSMHAKWYENYIHFDEAFALYANSTNGCYFRHDGFLFKDKRFCVLRTSIRKLLVNEAYEGGLMGQFREHKTYEVLIEHFFWSHMKRDIYHICERYLVCRVAKSKTLPHDLYTLLLILTSPWIGISMDFVLNFPTSKGGKDFIFLVVDRFSKISHFIPFHKVDDTCHVTNLFFRKIKRLQVPWTFLEDPMEIVNYSTSQFPFELVHGFNSLSPLDLFPLSNKRKGNKARYRIEKKRKQYAKQANKGKREKLSKRYICRNIMEEVIVLMWLA